METRRFDKKRGKTQNMGGGEGKLLEHWKKVKKEKERWKKVRKMEKRRKM